jgi:hypothetical protein
LPTRIQRYSGRNIEEAVQRALEDLGDDAEILHARKVRRGGAFGFFATEHVEVTGRSSDRTTVRMSTAYEAAPVSVSVETPEPALVGAFDGYETYDATHSYAPADPTIWAPVPRAADARPALLGEAMPFEDHLQRVMATVEARERAPENGSSVFATAAAHRFGVDDLAPLDDAEPATSILPPPEPTVIDLRRTAVAASAPRPATGVLVATAPTGPRWAMAALQALGVPVEILTRVPTPYPTTDSGWTLGLEQAIAQALPSGPSSAISLNGHGPDSAVMLLEHALRGHALGQLHLAQGAVDATPFELALAVRSCLPR